MKQTAVPCSVSYAESSCVTEVEREPREGEKDLKGWGQRAVEYVCPEVRVGRLAGGRDQREVGVG